MLCEGAIAVRAEAAAIRMSTVRVYTQAGVLVSREWAKIQPALSGRSGSVRPNQNLDVMGLIVPVDSASLVVSLRAGLDACWSGSGSSGRLALTFSR